MATLRFEKDGNIIEIENYREEIKEKFNRLLVETSEESRFYDEGTSYTIDDKGQKLVSTDVGFHYFYIQYKNDKFVDSLGNEVNINVLNGVWSIYEPNLVDKFINKLWGI